MLIYFRTRRQTGVCLKKRSIYDALHLKWPFLATQTPRRPPPEQHWQPLALYFCAERTIKVDCRRVPVEHLPAHAVAVLLVRDDGHPLQERFANALATKLGSHEQILYEQAGASCPRRISEEIERVCCWFTIPLCNEGVKTWVFTKGVAQQVLRSGIDLLQFVLELGEFTNHLDDERCVGCDGFAYYKHG